jgi:hypothetical protein
MTRWWQPRSTGALRALAAAWLVIQPGRPLAGQAETSLTVYNDGRVLVRRTFPIQLPAGQSEQRVALGPVDPATVFPLDPAVEVLGSRYDGGVDYSSVLRRSLGRRLVFQVARDTVSAEVVGVDPERYRLADGSITFQAPGTPRFPAELVVLDPTLRMTLGASEPRRDLRLGYFTAGGGWAASYQVLLSGAGAGTATARILGQAVVNGGALRVKDAELQLLAGKVSVAARDEMRSRVEGLMAARAAEAPAVAEQKVGEFHLYTLPGRASLEPGVVTTVALFEPAQAKVTRNYEVRGQLPYWGGLSQSPEENPVPVTATYTIQRPRKTDFGDRPLPGGVARLFAPDSAGRPQLVGESEIAHTPAGEDLRIDAGQAFDLTARRVQTSFTTRRDSVVAGQWRTVATADYRVTLANAGDQPVAIDVIEERGGEWSVVSSSVKPEKLSSTRTRFRVPVPAGGTAALTYRVRVVW